MKKYIVILIMFLLVFTYLKTNAQAQIKYQLSQGKIQKVETGPCAKVLDSDIPFPAGYDQKEAVNVMNNPNLYLKGSESNFNPGSPFYLFWGKHPSFEALAFRGCEWKKVTFITGMAFVSPSENAVCTVIFAAILIFFGLIFEFLTTKKLRSIFFGIGLLIMSLIMIFTPKEYSISIIEFIRHYYGSIIILSVLIFLGIKISQKYKLRENMFPLGI